MELDDADGDVVDLKKDPSNPNTGCLQIFGSAVKISGTNLAACQIA